MIHVNGEAIESHCVEWGLWTPEDSFFGAGVYEMDSEKEARTLLASVPGSKVVARHVYETPWAEVAE